MNKPLTFGSVCSGIEAASVAWPQFEALWLSEIEPFPCAVLDYHYPFVPNLGDMTLLADAIRAGKTPAPDILVGGTPCQAFSIAGLRGGMDDDRGALSLCYVDIANAIDEERKCFAEPECITVWENVPGALSDKSNAFGCFLGALVGEDIPLEPEPRPAACKSSRYWRWDKTGYDHTPSWPVAGCVYGPQRTVAWRILDAQHFGLAQRRRRLFVVSSARDGICPAKILFEWEGVRRDIKPSRETTESTAAVVTGDANGASAKGRPVGFRMTAFGEYADDDTASTMKARDYKDATDLVIMAVHGTQDPDIKYDLAHTLGRNSGQENAICVPIHDQATRFSGKRGDKQDGKGNGFGVGLDGEPAPTLTAGDRHAVAYGAPMVARRFTPRECERLQGFADDYTLVPFKNKTVTDSPRYMAVGNSMPITVMHWIGQRIEKHEKST